MAEHTSPDEGRERLQQRDRDADTGERVDEYAAGRTNEDDALERARRQAVEESTGHDTDQPPGVTPLEESWQREKQMTGQTADQPGKPRAWRDGGDAPASTGEGTEEEGGRGPIATPGGAGGGSDRTDPGTDTGPDTMGRPLREDELPDSGDVTQG